MLKITLDDYATIFRLTPTGIIRHLRLIKPVDREKQMSYTFTVGIGLGGSYLQDATTAL